MFYIRHKPVYTLKECLNLVEKLAFDLIWLNFRFVTGSTQNIVSKKEKISILEKELPKILKKSVQDSWDNHVIEGLKENTPCSEVVLKYLHIGIEFTFLDKGKTIPVIPNEFRNVYQQLNTTTWRLKKQEEFLINYLMAASMIYGIFPKKILETEWKRVFCEEFDYKKFHSVLEESTVKYDGKNYFVIVDFIEEILRIGENVPYKQMNINEIMNYLEYFSEQFEIASNIVNLSADVLIEFFQKAFFLRKNDLKNTKELMDEFGMEEKEQEKLQFYFNDWNKNIRRWLLNGHTIDELSKKY